MFFVLLKSSVYVRVGEHFVRRSIFFCCSMDDEQRIKLDKSNILDKSCLLKACDVSTLIKSTNM